MLMRIPLDSSATRSAILDIQAHQDFQSGATRIAMLGTDRQLLISAPRMVVMQTKSVALA
jgi:hypothetical protein